MNDLFGLCLVYPICFVLGVADCSRLCQATEVWEATNFGLIFIILHSPEKEIHGQRFTLIFIFLLEKKLL